jgi:hypothetical protein
MFMFLLFSMSFVCVPRVSADEPPVHEYTLDIPCFAPTKVTFNYMHTNNHSISDISTVGHSLYKHSGGPTYFEFIADEIDDYSFTISISYVTATNQTILVGVWSGTLPMQGMDYTSTFRTAVFKVHLRVQREPTYPTEQEVASAVVAQVQKNLADLYNQMIERDKSRDVTMLTVTIVSVVAVSAAIVGTVVQFYELKRFRQQRG